MYKLIFVVVFCLINGVTLETETEPKAKTLYEATAKTIPFLNMNEYLNFVKFCDPDYDVITLFTLRNTAGDRCKPCDRAFSYLRIMGREMRQYEHPIFVVGVDIESQMQLFTSLKLDRVPRVQIRSAKHKVDEMLAEHIPIEIEHLKKWILMTTGQEVQIMSPKDFNLIIGRVVYGLLGAGVAFIVYKYFWKKIGLTCIASIMVYLVINWQSGAKFNEIRNTPYFIANAQGQPEVIGDGQGQQTQSESMMITSLYLTLFVSFLILTEIKYVTTWKIFPRSFSLNKRRWIVFCGAMYMVFFSFSMLLVLMQHKSGSNYPYSFMLSRAPQQQ